MKKRKEKGMGWAGVAIATPSLTQTCPSLQVDIKDS